MDGSMLGGKRADRCCEQIMLPRSMYFFGGDRSVGLLSHVKDEKEIGRAAVTVGSTVLYIRTYLV